MKKYVHCLAAVLQILFSYIFFCVNSHAQKLDWVNHLASPAQDMIYDVAIGSDGSRYITGHFSSTVNFDPNFSTFFQSSGATDAFLAKYDANGNLLWVKTITGPSHSDGFGIALDSQENVYVLGNFTGTNDFDPTSSTFNLTASVRNIYFTKYTSSGTFLWAKHLVGTEASHSATIAIDNENNIIIAGAFSGVFDTDPGPGIANYTATDEAFVAKYNGDGNLIWSRGFGGAGSAAIVSLAIDTDNRILIGGNFSDATTFNLSSGQHVVTAAGQTDFFFGKYDADGNFLWVKTIGGVNYDAISSCSIDENNNIYLYGNFSATVDFDPSVGNHIPATLSGQRYAFLAKYDSSGNYVWVSSFHTNQQIYPAISLIDDELDEIYVSGSYYGKLNFDSTAFQYSETNCDDSFLAKYTLDGKCIYANVITKGVEPAGGGAEVRTMELYTDKSMYMGGYLSADADFDPSSSAEIVNYISGGDAFHATYNLCEGFKQINITSSGNVISAPGDADFYQWYNCDSGEKIPGATNSTFTANLPGNYKVFVSHEFCTQSSACAEISLASVEESPLNHTVAVYPNPTTDILFIAGKEKYNIKIFSIEGKLIYDKNLSDNSFIDVASFSNGLYTLHASTADAVMFSLKFIKQ